MLSGAAEIEAARTPVRTAGTLPAASPRAGELSLLRLPFETVFCVSTNLHTQSRRLLTQQKPILTPCPAPEMQASDPLA